MANGPLGLNTRLLLPPHRSSTQHTRTQRCSTWNCLKPKHTPRLSSGPGQGGPGPGTFLHRPRVGVPRDAARWGEEGRGARARGKSVSRQQPPRQNIHPNHPPPAFRGRGQGVVVRGHAATQARAAMTKVTLRPPSVPSPCQGTRSANSLIAPSCSEGHKQRKKYAESAPKRTSWLLRAADLQIPLNQANTASRFQGHDQPRPSRR